MPIYRYKCVKCGYEDDSIRSIAERDDPMLHECGGEMGYMFVPTRARPVVYGPGHPREGYGGPAAFARQLASKNQVDMGGASVDEFNAYMDKQERYAEEKIDKMAWDMTHKLASELREDLYTPDSQQRSQVAEAPKHYVPEAVTKIVETGKA